MENPTIAYYCAELKNTGPFPFTIIFLTNNLDLLRFREEIVTISFFEIIQLCNQHDNNYFSILFLSTITKII